MLNAALDYLKEGKIIHRLTPHNDPDITTAGKRPIDLNWQKAERQPTVEEIVEWFSNGNFNMGLQCGKRSNTTVIDFDNMLFYHSLITQLDIKTRESYRTEGRCHVYFTYNSKFKSKKYHELGIEILNDGSNAVLPPSTHKSGVQYQWRNSVPAIAMPTQLEERLQKLFKCYDELQHYKNQINRSCLKKLFNEAIHGEVNMHGANGRDAMLCLCTELRKHGAELKHVQLLATLIYRDKYDAHRTEREYRYISPWTWRCKTVEVKLSNYICCDRCRFKKAMGKGYCPYCGTTIRDNMDQVTSDFHNLNELALLKGEAKELSCREVLLELLIIPLMLNKWGMSEQSVIDYCKNWITKTGGDFADYELKVGEFMGSERLPMSVEEIGLRFPVVFEELSNWRDKAK